MNHHNGTHEIWQIDVFRMGKGDAIPLAVSTISSHVVWAVENDYILLPVHRPYKLNSDPADRDVQYIQDGVVACEALYAVSFKHICHSGVYPESIVEMELQDERPIDLEIFQPATFINIAKKLYADPYGNDIPRHSTFIGILKTTFFRSGDDGDFDIEWMGAIDPESFAKSLIR